MDMNFEPVWDTNSDVTESPVWDQKGDRLLFADLFGGRIFSLGLTDGKRQEWNLGQPIGSFGVCRSGRWVVALHRHVAIFDPRTGSMEILTPEIPEPAINVLNDGKVGPDGAFWVGGRDPRVRSQKEATASLYRVTGDGKIETKSSGYFVCNGLAWSADGRTMFHSDSTAGRVDIWDFDPKTGNISNQRTLAHFKKDDGHPDGAACDVDGNYWTAGAWGQTLYCIAPDGRILQALKLPIPTPTMPCFVGDVLFITSIRKGLDADIIAKHPGIGGLYKMKAPVKGAEVGLFAD